MRLVARVCLALAVAYLGWMAWKWIVGDSFDSNPATAPNAFEALDVEFTVRHPGAAKDIAVRVDLASRFGVASSADAAVGRRDDGVFVRIGSADWQPLDDENTQDAKTAESVARLLEAIDSARVLTIDTVLTPAGWADLDIVDIKSTTIDSVDFIARRSFDPERLGSPVDVDQSFPIPRLVAEPTTGPITATVITLTGNNATIDVDLARRLDVASAEQIELIVDDAGVVHEITTIAAIGARPGSRNTVYRLERAAIERPLVFDGTGLDTLERITPPSGRLDLDMASREAIGPMRFQRIVDRTGVTMRWGNPDSRRFDAVASWSGVGRQRVMTITVSGFRRDGRDDLLAHELAHIAAFGIDILDGSHECLADIVASHWLGHKVEMGAYDYVRCESHGDAQRVIAAYE